MSIPIAAHGIGIKLGTTHVIHQKLVNFMYKKDIYAAKLKSVIFGI